MHYNLTSKKKIYTIKSKILSNRKFSLAYSYHSLIPRVKQSLDTGEIFLESRILDGLSLDYIADKLSNHWLKMFNNPGMWTIYIPSKIGLALFVISTRKKIKKNGPYLTAEFVTSYNTSDSIKIARKMRDQSKAIIHFEGDFIDTFAHRETPNKDDIGKDSKEISKEIKKNKKIWKRKQRALKKHHIDYNTKFSKNGRSHKKWKHFEEKTFEEIFN